MCARSFSIAYQFRSRMKKGVVMNLVAKSKTMLLALAGLSGFAFGATDYSSWASYREVTVNTSAMSLSGHVTNIPILIRFNAADHADMLNNGATQILAGGTDVRVTKADGITDVPFEIESATTGASGALVLWVLADSVAQNSATAATFRVFWGKAGATTISNPAAVFSPANGFQAVFHLSETGGAGTAFTDAVRGITTTTEGTAENTTNPIIGTSSRAFGTGTSSGQSNNGAAATNYAFFNPPVGHPLHAHTGPITISAWGRTSLTSTGNRTAGDKHIIYHGQGNTGANHIYIKRWGVTGTADGAETAAGSNRIVAGGDTLVDSGGPYVGFGEAGTTVDHWAFYAGVWDGTNWTTHKMRRQNEWGIGSGAHPNASGGIAALTHPDSYNSTTKPGNGAPVGTAGKSWFLGGWAADGDGAATTKNRGWHGQLDEVRIETVARSNDFMKLRFMVERGTVSAANPVTIGTTQVPPPGPYSAWSNSRNIKLNTSATGANVTGNVTNFPVLVRLAANEASILSAAKAGGADIRFSKSNGLTALPYEIESWSGSAASIWVLVDTVFGNNANQTIKMYWGNAAANSESDGAAVFGSANGFVGVWHMGNASGAAARPNAVSGGNPATPAASAGNLATGFIPVAGMVGMADTLRNLTNSATVADEDHFDLGASGYNSFTSNLTMSMWIYLASAWPGTEYVHFVSLGAAATNNNLWMGRIGNTDNFATQSCNNTTCGDTRTATGALAPLGEWAHIAVRHSGTNGRTKTLFKNGVQIQNNGSNSNNNNINGSNIRTLNYIGRSVWGDRNLRAKVDEVRISAAGRSNDWIRLSYQSQQRVHTLTDIGAPPPEVPDAPVGVSAVAGTGQAFVEWSAPADDGRSPIPAARVPSAPPSARARSPASPTAPRTLSPSRQPTPSA
jgi:hypothetical protein